MSLLAPAAGALQRAERSAIADKPLRENVPTEHRAQTAARTIEVFTDLSDAKEVWRSFEEHAHGSIYQSYDWCKTWLDCFDEPNNFPVIVVAKIGASPALLLPLHARQTLAGIVQIEPIGGHHANIRIPLTHRHPDLRDSMIAWVKDGFVDDLTRHLRLASAGDFLSLGCMAQSFGDTENLLLGGDASRCSDAVFGIGLPADFDAFALARRGKPFMKKLRSKMRALETIGPIRLDKADTVDDVDEALSTFFAQKKQRFDALKMFNRFDHAKDRSFLRALGAQSVKTGSGSLDVYRLFVGEEVAAVFALGHFQGHASGAVHSMSSAPHIAGRSPGDVMLYNLMKRLAGEGSAFFDLGFGDHRYKQSWTDTIPLYSIERRITARGWIIGFINRAQSITRSALLSNPLIARFARQARYIIARLQG